MPAPVVRWHLFLLFIEDFAYLAEIYLQKEGLLMFF